MALHDLIMNFFVEEPLFLWRTSTEIVPLHGVGVGKGRRFMLRKSFSNLGKLGGPGGKGKPGKRQWEKHSE